VSDAAQGSDAWKLARAGHATASCFEDILAVSKTTGKALKARDDYIWRVATERLYGAPMEGPTSRSLEWGSELEPFARAAYELETGDVVVENGFILHPTIPWVGCSLDGMIGTDGTYESKCPKDSAVHMRTWANGMPEAHRAQIYGGLWISGRQFCMFCSFDPRATPEFQLYIERIERDDKYIAELSEKVQTFLADVGAKVALLMRCAKKAA